MMIAFKIAALLFLLIYIGYLVYGAIGFKKTNYFVLDESQINKTKTCIIICARNEEQNIEKCLRSIINQNFDFSLLEVIIVNDGSTDNTLSLSQKTMEDFKGAYQILNHKTSLGKKACITSAIGFCDCELIITKDADTFAESPYWLKTIVSYYEQTNKQFIICPLEIENKSGLLNQLQFFENNALSIITGGFAFYKKAFLCNGANLAFTKKLFKKIGGYEKHLHVNSGDDVLFLEEVKEIDPETIGYLKNKNAAIITYPVKGLKKLLAQKVRWASKFDLNPNPINTFLGLIAFLVHVFGLFYLIKPIFAHHIPIIGIIFIFLRVLIDFLLLFLASRYYSRPVKWLWFVPLAFFYSFYVIVTALLSLIIKPKRK